MQCDTHHFGDALSNRTNGPRWSTNSCLASIDLSQELLAVADVGAATQRLLESRLAPKNGEAGNITSLVSFRRLRATTGSEPAQVTPESQGILL
jgi:hypothetical protein